MLHFMNDVHLNLFNLKMYYRLHWTRFNQANPSRIFKEKLSKAIKLTALTQNRIRKINTSPKHSKPIFFEKLN